MAVVKGAHRRNEAGRFSPPARAVWTSAGTDRSMASITRTTGELASRQGAAVWAFGIIQARVGDHKVAEDLAPDQGLGDDAERHRP